jgi:hypothetical protein
MKAALGEVAKRHAKLIVKPLEGTDLQYVRERPCCFYRPLSSNGIDLPIFQIFSISKTKNGANPKMICFIANFFHLYAF